MTLSDRLKGLGEFLMAFAIMLACVIIFYRIFHPASLRTFHACMLSLACFVTGGWAWWLGECWQRL